MTVSDTHADTIRAGLLDTSNALVAGTMTETAFNGIAALDALVVERDRERARADRAEAAHRRVVANESNHYDRYWTPPPEPLTDEWLDATEAKMREALTDVFCDDAAAIMIALIAEIRSLR